MYNNFGEQIFRGLCRRLFREAGKRMGRRGRLPKVSSNICICLPFLFLSYPFLGGFLHLTPIWFICCWAFTSPPSFWLYIPPSNSVLTNLIAPYRNFSILSPCDYFRNCLITHFPHPLTNSLSWHKHGAFWLTGSQGSPGDSLSDLRIIIIHSWYYHVPHKGLTTRCTKLRRTASFKFLTPYSARKPETHQGFWACNGLISARKGQRITGFEIILRRNPLSAVRRLREHPPSTQSS